MKRFLPILALAVLLAGCAGVFKPIDNPVSPSQFAVAEAAYGTILAAAVNYKRACVQKLIPQSCRSVIVTLQPYQAKAQTAVVAARKYIKANDTINVLSAIPVAVAAINALRDAALANGVK